MILPEPIVRCPKCNAHIADIDPKWIAEYEVKPKPKGPPWNFLRQKVLEAWREVGALKGWMTQGECGERDCDGQWWDGERLNVAVPHHLKEAKADELRGRSGSELCDDQGDPRHPESSDASPGQGDLAEGRSKCIS